MSSNDSDTESVATDFTEASIIHPGHEYDADRILAEGQYLAPDESPGVEYLVKWSGYDFDRCTWEPGENCDQSLLSAWLQLKQSGGDDFDLDAWNERQLRLTGERIKRRKKRNRKRVRKGLAPWPAGLTGAFYEAQDPPESETADDRDITPSAPPVASKRQRLYLDTDDDSDDDKPLAWQKRRKSSTNTDLPASKEKQTLPADTNQDHASPMPLSSKTAATTKLPINKAYSNPLASLKPAMRREPSSQELHGVSRESSLRGARRTLAPNVFDNGLASSTSATRSTDGRSRRGRPGLYSHLSFRNIANKAKEMAPAHMPHLTELGTGRAVPAAQRLAAAVDQAPSTNGHASTRPLAAPPPDSSGEDDDVDERGRSAKQPGFLTCWFWARTGQCHHKSSCAFEHCSDYNVAAFENKLMKHQATCYYWATQGRCHHSEERCAWSHNLTGYVAHPNRQPVKMTPEMAKSILEKTRDFAIKSIREKYESPIQPVEKLGCWYYHMTPRGCVKASETCKFSHDQVDWVATVGGKDGSVSRVWLGQISGTRQPTQPGNDDPHRIRDQHEDSAPPARRSKSDSPSPPPRVRADAPAEMVLPYGPPQRPTSRTQNNIARRTSRDETSALAVKIVFHLFKPEMEVAATLEGWSQTSHPTDIIHSCRNMTFSQMLLKPLLAVHLSGAFLAGTPNDILSEHFNKLEAVRHKLVEADGAAVLTTEFCMVLVFPNRKDWQFLDANAGRSAASLRFGLLKPIEAPLRKAISPKKVVAAEKSSGLRNMFSAIDMTQLFALPNVGTREERRNVFLVFPNSQADVLDALAAMLLEKGADVFHSGIPGSWAQFGQLAATSSKSFIVFHNSIENFAAMPGLHELLKFSSVDVFRLFPGKPVHYPGGGTGICPAKMVRLFPRGRVVLLMDDCFEEELETTLEAIEYFAKRASNLEYGKIIGGPDLMDRLLHPPHDTHASDQQLLFKSWKLLKDTRDLGGQEHGDYNFSSELLNFFCATEDSLPDYSAMWQSGDPKKKADALQFLAIWFSMWASNHADQWRRFILITTAGQKTRKELQKLHQHLMVVTPDKYVRLEESIEKHKASQGRIGEHKRPPLSIAGLSAGADLRSAFSSPVEHAPVAVAAAGSGPPTPIDARLTPRSTPRSPETVKDAERDVATSTGPVDPRLKLRQESQQRSTRR